MPTRKNGCFGILSVAVASATLSGAALAAPIHYTESVMGDLPAIPSSGFLFDVGSNTIAGTTHLGVNVPGHGHFDSDFDSFAFNVPTGEQLTDISVSFSTVSDNAAKANSELRFCSGVDDCGAGLVDLLGSDTLDFLGSSPFSTHFGVPLPIAAGSYSLLTSGLGIAPIDSSDGQEAWSANYTWKFDVVAVPEPGILWLFGASLILLAGASLQRRPAALSG